MRADDTVMPNPNVFIEFGSGIHYGGMSDDRRHVLGPFLSFFRC
jgi:hypothetical protein